MIPKTREQMIVWAEDNLTHSTARRALIEGSVEWLGGFSRVPPNNNPGWIIRARSRFSKTWYIAITISRRDHLGLLVYTIDSVPWKYWDGDESKNILYLGDRPELYRRLKG